MNSSDGNISLSTNQPTLSQQNVLERVADRSAQKTFFLKNGRNLCLEKEVRDYKSLEMISKFTSQNGRVLSLKIQTNQSEKHIQDEK